MDTTENDRQIEAEREHWPNSLSKKKGFKMLRFGLSVLLFPRINQWRLRGWAKWATAQGLTRVLVCIGIAFFPYIVAVLCLIHVLLCETKNNEGIEKVFNSFQIVKIIMIEIT
jgi:hypothetical protein